MIMTLVALGRHQRHDYDGCGGAHSSNPTQCAGFSTAPRSIACASLAAIHSNSAAGTVSPPSPAMNEVTSGRFAAWYSAVVTSGDRMPPYVDPPRPRLVSTTPTALTPRSAA